MTALEYHPVDRDQPLHRVPHHDRPHVQLRRLLLEPNYEYQNILNMIYDYRGLGIYDVKGSVPVLFSKLHYRKERGRKGRECKFQNKAHRTMYV